MKRFRLLGYYCNPGQNVNPESKQVQEANELAPLLETSINSILLNPDADNDIKNAIQKPTVFVFKDEDSHLFGYFTRDRIALINGVVYNRNFITQIPYKYKSWFKPGDAIPLSQNSNTENTAVNTSPRRKRSEYNPDNEETRVKKRAVSKEEMSAIKLIRKNWKLKDEYFIGQIRYSTKNGDIDKDKYFVVDVRRSDFSKINTKVNISGLSNNLDIHQYNRYYKFSWILDTKSTPDNSHFYIDTNKPVSLFGPEAIVNCIHDDIIDYPGSASQIIVKTLDTLKNQLTASGKEIFIYELLQNANDYPCKTRDGKPIPVNVEFRITDNYLIFQHTGAYFSPRNIAAICNINDKEKTDNTEAIGYKGIGFKTVFLDNNYVFLRTGDYSFRFDWEDSKDILDIPWQILPIWTPLQAVAPEVEQSFSSVDPREYKVQFALRPTKHSTLYDSPTSYVKLFNDVFETERVLLFIPNIGQVTFKCEGQEPVVRSKDSGKWCISDLPPADINDDLRLRINAEIEDGDTKIPEKYKDFYKTTVKFACGVEGDELKPVENTTLYCYLPTKKARLGLPFLMNTDMIPTGPRDDIEDIEVNYEICKIAGEKLCEWLTMLLSEGKYRYDSVFSLVPSFAAVTNYESFIEGIENGFTKSLEELEMIPVLDGDETRQVCLSKVIYDETGISEAGIMSDSDLLSFAYNHEWISSPDEFFPHPDLRGQEYFSKFIEKYHADDMVFGEHQFLRLCSDSGFSEWLQNQDNNNKFLQFLLEHDYLTTFIEKKRKIFIGDDGKLHDASDMYYDIDEHLKYLSFFADDYLLRLSVATREYFKDNEEWQSAIEDAFMDFQADDFVSEVLDDDEMKSLLKDKSNSISFFHFLVINEIENDELIDLPFFNTNDELVDDFDRLIFFASQRGIEVKSYEWIDNSWMDFISNDYYVDEKEKSVSYLKSQFGVLEYSDKVLAESIIMDSDKTSSINEKLDNIGTAIPFVDFVIQNSDVFEDSSLIRFHVVVIDKDGEECSGTADNNTFINSKKFEELIEKDWISNGWIYSLSEAYFEGRTEDEKKRLKLLFVRLFGVREFDYDIFVDDILKERLPDLAENIADIESNIDFWRWIKANSKNKASGLTDLPVIATDVDGEEGDYILSQNSIYMSDSLLPDGQYLESIVKKYYGYSLFLIPRYAENYTAAVKKGWRKFFEELGVMSEQTELVFDQIIPNLSEIEDPGIPSMLAQARDYFNEHDISISDLTNLRLEKRDGEYANVSDCIFISTKKVAEPFKEIHFDNECIISQYNPETRALILDIAEEAGATVIENIEDWRYEKISRYLEMQDANDISKDIHLNFIRELLDIDEKEKKSLSEDIQKIQLIAKNDDYYDQNELTLGKEYRPLCDFESNGITDEFLNYLAADYASFDCENLGTKIRDTFKVHYRFTSDDIDLLSNYTFADFFWRRLVPHKSAPIGAIKSMIEDGNFDNKECVPTPNGAVSCPEDLYSRKDLKDYMKLVTDWSSCYPCDDYPDTTYDVLDMLPFKDSLSFKDGLNALMNTEDQSKRYFILKWMTEEYSGDNEQIGLISEYRECEKSKWRNRNKKKAFLRDLYALDIDEKANSKYLEQYFKLHPRVILDDYFFKASNDIFYKECKMLQMPVIKWEDMNFEPELSERGDKHLPGQLRNYLLFVAAIEQPDNWSEYFNSLCESFDKLSFRKCRKISLTYSENEDISQTAKKFYHDIDDDTFYYVGEWDDRLVFTDFIDELRDVVGSEMDRDLFMQIFVPKQTIHELEEFANEYCTDLEDDDNFRNTLMKQLGVCLAKSEYEDDDEEPELADITPVRVYQKPVKEYDEDVDESEVQGDEHIEAVYEVEQEDNEDDLVDEDDEQNETTPFEVPNLGAPTGIIMKRNDPVFADDGDRYSIEEDIDADEDDDEDDEPVSRVRRDIQGDKTLHENPSPKSSRKGINTSAYKGQWEQAQQDSPAVRKRRNYSGYSPDKFKARQFNAGTQEPLTLSRRDIDKDEVQYLSNLFGRALNIDTIKDENYTVRMRFYNSLKENGLEMDMSERDYIEHGSSQITTKSGKYVHRCSARSGILYISPTVWNRLREGRWVVCFYSGKMADQFVYVRTQDELMEIINQDALVIQVTGNNKQEMVDKIYEDGFSEMEGNIYTLIRTIKVEGEVTPFDENVTDYYNDDDDQETDEL